MPYPSESGSSFKPSMNPYAVLQSIGERYNSAMNDASIDPVSFTMLQGELGRWMQTWQQELDELLASEGGRGGSAFPAERAALVSALDFGLQMWNKAGAAATGDRILSTLSSSFETGEMLAQEAWDEAVQAFRDGTLSAQGMYDTLRAQGWTDKELGPLYANISALDEARTAAGGIDPLTGLSIGEPGGGDFKPFEPVGDKPTPFANDFGNAFAIYSAEATVKSGIARGSDNILARNFQRLQTLYLGELGRRSLLDPADPLYEDPGVYDFVKVNIGKSTDPQFDQSTDRFQDQRIEPKLKPLDFLRSLDLEDIAASTVPEDRPGRGRAAPGFVGYVRRLNR